MLLRFLATLLLSLTLTGCSQAGVTQIGNEELKTLAASGVPVYDVRRAEEWQQTGVIQGSRKLTFVDQSGALMPDFVSKFTGAVRRDQPVILICRTGNRTGVLSRVLVEKLGYTRVYNVREGIAGWISEGRPVVSN